MDPFVSLPSRSFYTPLQKHLPNRGISKKHGLASLLPIVIITMVCLMGIMSKIISTKYGPSRQTLNKDCRVCYSLASRQTDSNTTSRRNMDIMVIP